MLTIYSDDHRLHHGRCELIDGQLMPCFEMPSRADHVLDRVKARNLGPISGPRDFGREPLLRVHKADYLEFFQGAWARWAELNRDGDLLPFTWPARTLRRVKPTSLLGELGYYSFDAGAPITAGTWQAAYSAAQVALTAQAAVQAGHPVALERISSIATSLGAKQVCEQAWHCAQTHPVHSLVIPDRSALAACERFLTDHRILVEPACGAALAAVYEQATALATCRKVLVIVCGGATATIDQIRTWAGQQDQA